MSSGEVISAETINYRTLKPERDGLFCERIFGPTKNWTCACGKYHNVKDKGKICERCGVRATSARVRRVRMGHIELAAPVCHTWYARGVSSKLALLLDMTQRELNHILSFTHYLVLHVDEVARQRELQRIHDEINRLEALQNDPTWREDTVPSQQKPVHAISTTWVAAVEGTTVGATSSMASVATIDILDTMDEIDVDEMLLAPEMEGNAAVEAEMYATVEERESVADEMPAYATAADFASLGDYMRHLQRVERGLWQLSPMSLLEIERYRLLRGECGHVFRAGIGAEAVQELLATLDLDALASSLRYRMYDEKDSTRPRLIKRLKVVEATRRSHTDPRWMVLSVLPILPPDLRPIVPVGAGRFASADVNELYSRVLHVNNRLKRFLACGAPELMIYHEKRLLQEACDALLDNRHCPRPLRGAQRQILRSLTDALSGKKGLFRHNLLGKRVDYSGRSVICVGPDLRIDQCGLPKKMALELFKPFIIHKLLAYNIVQTPRQAKRAVEQRQPVVWDILEEVMQGRYVLLNRAPTLHRLSIQAFEPVLIEGSAIRLPPQVCSAFNADFDGDQMAVHLPLSVEAQQEARELMLTTRNLLSPASGEPAISISQDMVLGCFYLTQGQPGKKGEGHVFTDANEAILAHQQGVVDLHAPVFVRIEQETIFEQPLPVPPTRPAKGKPIRTTVGRLLFNAALPKRLRFKNYAMKKEHLKQAIAECVKLCGSERTAIMADDIKRLGFAYATRAGISFAISDVVVPATKKSILAQADEKIQELDTNWRTGLITSHERYQQSIEIWAEATQHIEQALQKDLDPFGALATISNSGATKARLQQIRQLSGMRGLMASPSGAIIETPVRSNFLEGLNVAEYFISSHGARKSLMDRSLNTAESGYLTIRLINVAQDIIVTEEDCGTSEGIFITADDSAAMGLTDSRSRLIGRVLAEAVPALGLTAGDELNEDVVECLPAASVVGVRVRSVLFCQTRRGVCCRCYGWDLSQRALVQKGTPVGIIAAQSIGEPGTQLTMRTFHSGGIAGSQSDITQGIPRVEELFEGRVPKDPALVSETEGSIEVSKDEATGKHIVRIAADSPMLYEVPATRKLLVRSGQHIRVGEPITAGALNLHNLLRLRGREAVERYLLREVQRVYRTTGAYIHDKHFEVIIRQMLRRVSIDHPGDSDLLPGDLMDRLALVDLAARIKAQGGDPPTAHTILLGLTRATLATESWLAAAAFQQTGKVLSEAALEGRTDFLVGLKENVISGRLIPAGTGDATRLAREEQKKVLARTPPRKRRGRPRKKR